MKNKDQYTGTFETLDELIEAVKKLPADLKDLSIQTDTSSHFSPSSIKITFDNEDKVENMPSKVRQIITKALEKDKVNDPVDEFRLWSYFGDAPKTNDSCYIQLYSEGRRQFGRDMSAGKYGPLD